MSGPRLHLLAFLLIGVLSLCPPSNAAIYLGPSDLDSLCYFSSDVVEATIVKHVPSHDMVDDSLTVAVIDPIEGQYHVGDLITLDYGSEWYVPGDIGQRFFVFVDRNSNASQDPPKGSVDDVDILLIDDHDRVLRYYQDGNPGPLLAETYDWSGKQTGNDQAWPTSKDERAAIVAKWTTDRQLKPLLSRPATTKDVPALFSALRDLRSKRSDDDDHSPFDLGPPAKPAVGSHDLDSLICSRICDLGDPSLALDAIVTERNYSDYLGGATWVPFKARQNLDFVRSVLADTKEAVDRRIAAAIVLAGTDDYEGAAVAEQNRLALVAAAKSSDTPDAIRLVIINRLTAKQPATADALRQYYRLSTSEETKFAIERAFYYAFDDDTLYATLDSAPHPVLAIVRHSPDLPFKPGFLAVQIEVIQVAQPRITNLAWQYVFTNVSNGTQTSVDLGEHDQEWQEKMDTQVPLPSKMPKGIYRVAMEFLADGKVVGTSHYATVALPKMR